MHETLLEGDRVLVNKVGYHLDDVHRGDVVVFRKPPNLNVSEDDLIKRVVALPGETVEGRGGKVYVNGAPLGEPYVEPLCHGARLLPVTVPAGKLWVMGDTGATPATAGSFGPIDQTSWWSAGRSCSPGRSTGCPGCDRGGAAVRYCRTRGLVSLMRGDRGSGG